MDAYDLGGIIPPSGPPPGWAYRGTFYGPGALISDVPIPQPPMTASAVTTGERRFNAFIYGFRLGPYVEMSLARRLSCSLSVGLALAVVDSEVSFNETTTVAGLPITWKGSGRDSDVLLGGFVAGNVYFPISRSVDLFGGVQKHVAPEGQKVRRPSLATWATCSTAAVRDWATPFSCAEQCIGALRRQSLQGRRVEAVGDIGGSCARFKSWWGRAGGVANQVAPK